MDSKISDWRPGPTVCRCCLSEGCYKDISTEYFWMGKTEVYADMLSETFNLSISYSQSGGPNSNSRLICEPCISRLRDASEFKRQVQECEKTFINHLDSGAIGEPSTASMEIEAPTLDVVKGVKLEEVKLEKQYSDDEFDCRDFGDEDDDDDLDDQPLTTFATKVPKKESVDLLDLLDNTQITVKRKSKTKDPEQSKKPKLVRKATATVKAKASVSAKKVEVKPVEKKKKGLGDVAAESAAVKIIWKRKKIEIGEDKANAALILKHSNAVVFRYQRGKFMCAYCPQICTNVAEVRSHSSMHKDKLDIFEKSEVRNTFPLRVDVTGLSCSICSDAVENIEALKLHLKETHSLKFNACNDGLIPFVLTETEYKCVHCGIVYEGFMRLFIHMNQHYQSYICHTCGKSYSAKYKLRAHSTSHETGRFPCSKCDMIFSSRPVKNRHMASAHARKDKYRCPVCDTYFDSYHSRLRHLDKVHGQKAAYKCELCPAVFGSATLRYSHINHVHVNKKR